MNISQKLAWGVCLPNAQRVNGFMVYNSWIPNLICHITLKAYTLFYLHLLWPIPESWSLRGCFLSEIGLWPQPNGEASRGSVMRNISSDEALREMFLFTAKMFHWDKVVNRLLQTLNFMLCWGRYMMQHNKLECTLTTYKLKTILQLLRYLNNLTFKWSFNLKSSVLYFDES